jgi:hypothetical protein
MEITVLRETFILQYCVQSSKKYLKIYNQYFVAQKLLVLSALFRIWSVVSMQWFKFFLQNLLTHRMMMEKQPKTFVSTINVYSNFCTHILQGR